MEQNSRTNNREKRRKRKRTFYAATFLSVRVYCQDIRGTRKPEKFGFKHRKIETYFYLPKSIIIT